MGIRRKRDSHRLGHTMIDQLSRPSVRCSTLAATDQGCLSTASLEILATLVHLAQWSTLAWNDIKFRYRRTTLGPLWITLGLGATVFSVGLLYGVLFGNELSQYLP